MCAGSDAATLVWLLQEAGGGHGTVGPQGLVVLLPKTGQLLQSANDQSDGRLLCPRVCHLFLIQSEGLWGEGVGGGTEYRLIIKCRTYYAHTQYFKNKPLQCIKLETKNAPHFLQYTYTRFVCTSHLSHSVKCTYLQSGIT